MDHFTASYSFIMSSLYKYIILLLIAFPAIECKQFRFDYTYYPEIGGRLKLHRIPANFKDARGICDVEGAVLASPSTENMKNALESEVNKTEAEFLIYTGVNSILSKGYFYSIEGVPLEDMPLQWLPGEPNNAANNENCIAYKQGGVGDVDCAELFPYLCYKKGTETPKPSCEVIENEPKLSSGHCYKFYTETKSWPEAQKLCLATGGHLAVINSEEEAQLIRNIMSKYYDFDRDIKRIIYIGFNDWNREDRWRTINGQTLKDAGYDQFAPGHPYIPVHGPGCGGIFFDGDLVNGECYEANRFLCEYPQKN